MALAKADLTRPPDLTREHITGPIRHQRPIYQNLLPPCNHACPTGEDIQGWLALVQAQRFQEAWEQLVKNNPFPAVSGRICYHNCETSCNRAQVDEAVSIHAVERFIGDLAIEADWQFPQPQTKTGKRVLIIGAGPCGLAAAYHLALLGHTVEIFEAGPESGGLMHFGIPAYRLPREVLAAEVKRIENLGVKIRLNYPVEDIEKEKSEGNFDAVLLAIGAKLSNRIDIPGCDAAKILDAITYLRDVSADTPVKVGRRVAVYGGGNSAMDAARTARRMGAEETIIIYRKDREHMPAHDFELEAALSEDVKVHWLRRIKSIHDDEIVVEMMAFDEEGKLVTTGDTETLNADTLILALGQNVDSTFLQKTPEIHLTQDGSIVVDTQLMTGREGVFAGGDMIPGQRSATHAYGYGKRAAKCINAWLKNEVIESPIKKSVVSHDQLHLIFRTEAPQRQQPEIEPKKRIADFGEITQGLSNSEAMFEAKRCYSCGNCFECDGCMAACPQRAITKLGIGYGYEIDFNLCTGCGVCVDQCPCHAMELIPEPK